MKLRIIPGHILGIVILISFLNGCGYRQSGSDDYRWRSLYAKNVQTVAVPIFTNRDFHRGVEFSLSKAVINQLESHTPYKVAPRERADTILEGEIVSIRANTISTDRFSDLPQEQLLSVTVNFVWKDLRTGKILVQRKNFEQTATYYPTLGEGQFVGSQQAVERLALGIVQELQSDW